MKARNSLPFCWSLKKLEFFNKKYPCKLCFPVTQSLLLCLLPMQSLSSTALHELELCCKPGAAVVWDWFPVHLWAVVTNSMGVSPSHLHRNLKLHFVLCQKQLNTSGAGAGKLNSYSPVLSTQGHAFPVFVRSLGTSQLRGCLGSFGLCRSCVCPCGSWWADYGAFQVSCGILQ